jgi:hypothetical protein
MLCQIAYENKHLQYIELPDEVKEQNKEYINENNNILQFIHENFDITTNEKDKIKSSDLLSKYNTYCDDKTNSQKLKQMMEFNRFKCKRMTDGVYYLNLVEKKDKVFHSESESDDQDI